MPTTCVIELESTNQSQIIFSGQVLRGTVHLTLTNEKTIRGVLITFTGKAYCCWKKTYGKSTRVFKAEENHLNQQAYLIGSNNGEMKILPGAHRFPFECHLPPNLPTSVEGRIGHIRYSARVIIDVPMWRNKEFAQSFTVYRAIDLNADPRMRDPVAFKMSTQWTHIFPLFFCFKSNLEVTIRTPVSGFVPGETIPLEIAVCNNSSHRVYAFTVELIKQISYLANSCGWHQNLETIVISEGKTPGCNAGQNEVFNVSVALPLLAPTDWTTSHIVKVRYYCRVTAKVGFFYRNPIFQLPITIGTYPFREALPPENIPTLQTIPTAPYEPYDYIQQPTTSLTSTGPFELSTKKDL